MFWRLIFGFMCCNMRFPRNAEQLGGVHVYAKVVRIGLNARVSRKAMLVVAGGNESSLPGVR
jgi:hypothetical protein